MLLSLFIFGLCHATTPSVLDTTSEPVSHVEIVPDMTATELLVFEITSDLTWLDDSLFPEFSDSQLVSIVAFVAPWCPYSRALVPVLEELTPLTKYNVAVVDLEKSAETKEKFDIHSYPRVFPLVKGKFLDEFYGVRTLSNLVEWIEDQTGHWDDLSYETVVNSSDETEADHGDVEEGGVSRELGEKNDISSDNELVAAITGFAASAMAAVMLSNFCCSSERDEQV